MIYFGTDDGIYRWFAASPWPIFHGLQYHRIKALASMGAGTLAAIDGDGQIWETSNNGMEWRSVPLPEGAERPLTIAMGGDPASIWLATRPPRLQRKSLGRSGWLPIPSPSVPSGPLASSVRVLEWIGGTWFAGIEGAGLWRSADDGLEWTDCPGLPSEVYALRGSGAAIYSATAEGCFASLDGGQSWETRSGGGLESARHVRALEAHPGDPNHLLAGATSTTAAEVPAVPERRSSFGFRLYESRDGGQSWNHVKRGFPEVLEFDQIADIRFDPADPEYAIVALASGECWRTRNGGDWWEPIARQIKAVRVLCAVG